jgi:SOS-response transcriptional repressor LexA
MKKYLLDLINEELAKTSQSSQSRKYNNLFQLKKDIRKNNDYTLPKYLEKKAGKEVFKKYQNTPQSFQREKKKIRTDLKKLNFVPSKKVNYKWGKYDTYLRLKDIKGNKDLLIGISRKNANNKNMLNRIAAENIALAAANFQDRYSNDFEGISPDTTDYIMEVEYND